MSEKALHDIERHACRERADAECMMEAPRRRLHAMDAAANGSAVKPPKAVSGTCRVCARTLPRVRGGGEKRAAARARGIVTRRAETPIPISGVSGGSASAANRVRPVRRRAQ